MRHMIYEMNFSTRGRISIKIHHVTKLFVAVERDLCDKLQRFVNNLEFDIHKKNYVKKSKKEKRPMRSSAVEIKKNE